MRYNTFLKGLDKVIFTVLVILVSVMVTVGTMQVFWRYILKSSLFWSEEIMRYLNIWTIFLGVSLGIPRKLHVAIEALLNALKGTNKKVVTLIIHSIGVVFFMLLVYIGTRFTLFNIHQLSPAVRLPMSIVYAVIPVGGILSLLFLIGEIKNTIKGGTIS